MVERFGYLLRSKTFAGFVLLVSTLGSAFFKGEMTAHQAIVALAAGVMALGIRDAVELFKRQAGVTGAVAASITDDDIASLAQKGATALGLHVQIPEEKFPEIVEKMEAMLRDHLKDKGLIA